MGRSRCHTSTSEPVAPIPPVEQHKSLGAVHLTLVADRPGMGLTDTLKLTLTIAAPPEVRIMLPDVAKTLGPFEVVQHRTAGPLSLTPQTQQWQREYSLAVTTSGSLTVPSLIVQVQEGATPQPLATDPLSITVTALVPADADLSAVWTSLRQCPCYGTAYPLGVDSRQRTWRGGAPRCRLVVSTSAARCGRAAAPAPSPRARPRGPGTCAASRPHGPGTHRGVLCARVRYSATVCRVALRPARPRTDHGRVSRLRPGHRRADRGAPRPARDVLTTLRPGQICPPPSNTRCYGETFESAKTFVEHTADMHVLVTVPQSGEPVL